MYRCVVPWVLVLVVAGCGAGHHDAPDAGAPDDAGRDAGRDAGEDAAIDGGPPCANPPVIVGTYERAVGSVAAQGSIVLITAWNPGLIVLDASDPGNLVEVTELYPFSSAGGVQWSGDRAIVRLDRGNGWEFVVLDMTSPLSPVELGTLPEEYLGSAHLAPPFAYATRNPFDLLVFDVEEQSGPRLIARTALPGHLGAGMAIGERVAFMREELIQEETYSIHAVDITDPGAPSYAGVLVPPGNEVGWFLPLPGDLLYYWDGELELLDVSDPASPRALGSVDEPEGLLHGFVDNLFFYANPDADSPGGVVLGIGPLDDPLRPRIEWTVRLPVGAVALPAVSDGLAYVRLLGQTLFVVDLGCAVQ